MKIEELTKSSYGNTSNVNGLPVLFYSCAFYNSKPVGVGVWDYEKDVCLSAIVIDENINKVYLNKIDSTDLNMAGTLHELENLFEKFLIKE